MLLYACKSKLPRRSLGLLFLTLALLARVPLASAQASPLNSPAALPFEDRGAISGMVYFDNDQLPASQILVTIRSLSPGFSRSVLTDFSGHFQAPGLPLGTYQVIVEEQGYASAQAVAQVNAFPSEVALYLKSIGSGRAPANHHSVSVRQLQIPAKALQEYDRGLDRLAKHDPAGSLPHFNKAAAAFPGYYEAYYHLGVAEMRLNHQDEAMQAFQKSIDLSGGRYVWPQFAYGLLLCSQGNPEEAQRIIRRGLETNPNAPEGHLFLALSLLALNRLEEAEKSVREALLRKPQLADAYLVLSDIHARRSDYRAQLQDLDTYLKLAPSATANAVREVRDVVQRLTTESGSAPRESSPQN